ncbi:GIN domain-containing protein [Methylocapsa sp. S129]|uniref:GIN domain-containing protein n=1 Tax=Methylocapsa sp. S129 TaxID=1641869 RepID=UPI00131DA5EF|nr:DUF2807 domain-containing protein [Methylocapsa sp. S129]
MRRTSILIAAVGTLGAFVFLAPGVVLSGQYRAHAATWSRVSQLPCESTASSRTQVILPFTPGDSLTITLPGSVRYRPGDKAEAVVTGDAALLDHVRLENGTLSLDCEPNSSKLEIDLTGPAIADWKLQSSANLTLTDISQRQLRLTITGSGNVMAAGAVETVGLKSTGSGNAELKSLVAKSAEIATTGSGGARLTAETNANVSITGSGNVELFGNPTLSRSKVTGSGRIIEIP